MAIAPAVFPSWYVSFDPLTIFLVAWWTVVGAMIGSFVNVVVWRLPRGESLSQKGSHCPACHHPIRFYDNIPIVSYWLLGGRCRDCDHPISARYPTVEAIFAALFLVVAVVEGGWGLANVPHDTLGARPPAALVWGTVSLHLVLLSCLLTALLMERDGWSVPARLFVPSLATACLLPVVIPGLAQPAAAVSWLGGWADWQQRAAHLGIHALLGYLSALVCCSRAPRVFPPAWMAASVALHLTLGWQLASWLVALTAFAAAVFHWQRLIRPRRLFGLFFWYVLIGVLGWQTWTQLFPWTATGTAVSMWTVPLAITAVAAWSLRHVVFPATDSSSTHTSATSSLTRKDHDSMNRTPPDRQAILDSPSYRLPELDTDFLQRPELRPVRVQLELLKPEIVLEEQRIRSTVVVFGGTQIVERPEAEQRVAAARAALAEAPDDAQRRRALARAERVLAKSHYYDEARQFARIVSLVCQCNGQCDFVIITGGGPGIMEAANRGAYDAGSKSIGLNITLPEEQLPNRYISPELCFQFHYFAMRKMHFLLRARALVVFPGGFGTLDELFDALTLRQTERMQDIPIILYGTEYWKSVIDFQRLADEGVIRDEHLDLIHFADAPGRAWEIIARYHGVDPETGTLCQDDSLCADARTAGNDDAAG